MTKKEQKIILSLFVFLIAAISYALFDNTEAEYTEEGKIRTGERKTIVSPEEEEETGRAADEQTRPAGYHLVTRVIDGDTIELETGQKVRYIGVNAPESVSPKKGVECFGKEASEYNKQLVINQFVRLEKDVSETDKYHRLLRYVYLEDGMFVNLKMVEDGYAYAWTYPPDVGHSAEFVTAQQEAKEAGRGLWGTCK